MTRPWVSQHLTLSPPTPTTRLMRSFSSSDGSRPMKARPSLTCLTTTGSSFLVVCSPASQPPGSRKTTTSPRCGSEPNQGVSLSTRTRSPIRMVCSMEPDGITKACTRKVLSTSAIRTATPTRSGISLTAPRLRRRFTLRWSLRRSARERPPEGAEVRLEPVGSRFSAGLLGAPRGLPRLPIGARGPLRVSGPRVRVAVRHARVGVGTVEAGGVGEGPDDPVGAADHPVHRHHAAAR